MAVYDNDVSGHELGSGNLDDYGLTELEPNEVAAIIRFKPEALTKANETIATLRTDQVDKQGEIDRLFALYEQAEKVAGERQIRIQELEAEIVTLKAELAIYKPPPPPPPPPPIETSPDITISLGDLGSFRPGIGGERQGNETRYRGTINNEIDAIIDIKDDGQIAICIERCHHDLPLTAQVINTQLTVSANGIGDTEHLYINAFRLHPHTRPRLVLNPSPPPRFDLSALISSSLIPNYALSTISATDLDKMAKGSYPWEKWNVKWSHLDFDPISEVYGPVIRSWTGGANSLMNEASHLAPVQVAYLMSADPRAWNEVIDLANSSGNYAVHYKLRGENRYPYPSETAALPFLQGDAQVTIFTAGGFKLPIPEPAHEHSLTYLAYLLTGERWYKEELQAWVTYNLLTRPRNDLRLKGIIWSGQIRAAAWSTLALLRAAIAESPYNAGPYASQLVANLNYMRDTFTVPSALEYRSTGVCNLSPFRPAELLAYVTLLPRPLRFPTWNHHVLASVLNECIRAGFNEAIPMRDHLTRVVQGQWQYGQSRYDIGWGDHAYVTDSWPDIIRTTFEGRATPPTPPTSFPAVTTPEYISWARSAIVAAVDSGQEWATEALRWVATEAPKYKGGIPPWWAIMPSAGASL